MDESYVVARKDNPEWSFNSGGDGVIGGVLFDAANPLPKQPQLHASQDSAEEQMTQADQVVETLITSRCGVLAVPVSAYSAPQGWGAQVGAYIDLVLRLLPLGEKPCELSVFVENRDPYFTSKDFNFLRDACAYRLMQTLPERAKQIKLSISVQTKDDPYNAYPDIISHSCRMNKQEKFLAAPRFRKSGWAGSCYLDYPAEDLSRLLEHSYNGTQICPKDWDFLLKAGNINRSSIIMTILNTLGFEVRKDVALWQKYLNHMTQHLESKAISIYQLGNQLRWLKEYMPAKSELPPKLRLLWLTAKLAEENHRGCVNTFPGQRKEFTELSQRLFEEDAPLVCNAALHLAVSYTDEYDFQGARTALDIWRNQPPAVPGLQLYGRLLSSYGQHEAFLGNPDAALPYFLDALEAFRRLSDPHSAFLDIQQTSAYLLTVLMDLLPEQKEMFQTEAVKYFGAGIRDTATELAGTNEEVRKYQHHILLRYLAGKHALPEEREAYLAVRENWKTGDGHPWEMIELYRALLTDDKEEKLKHLNSAYDIAMQGSGTLHVIAAVIAGIRLLLEPERESEYLELVAICEKEVPRLGGRIDILKEHIQKKYSPLELAEKILPFNFR